MKKFFFHVVLVRCACLVLLATCQLSLTEGARSDAEVIAQLAASLVAGWALHRHVIRKKLQQSRADAERFYGEAQLSRLLHPLELFLAGGTLIAIAGSVFADVHKTLYWWTPVIGLHVGFAVEEYFSYRKGE